MKKNSIITTFFLKIKNSKELLIFLLNSSMQFQQVHISYLQDFLKFWKAVNTLELK